MSRVLTPPFEKSALLAGYHPPGDGFNELFTPEGDIRPHYLPLVRDLEKLGPSELARREEELAGALSRSRASPTTCMVSHGAWSGLGRSTRYLSSFRPTSGSPSKRHWVQRATLINRILQIVMAPQELIRSGWLPPALVFAQPEFLRPCHGIQLPHDTFLHFYAADLAPRGRWQWWVTSDRTQIPTGAGYCPRQPVDHLQNPARAIPQRECTASRRLFRELQSSLARLAFPRTDNPRVVLLTPGPYNETYFEQAWLARYLGYMLVEGQDLTVRDDRVFLKTLSGLEPVDVLLRRVDDDFCDPLELRNDSMLGVPGLLEALRAGNVALANGLGSGLLQSPAFLGFLPGLCRHLFNEDLKLPSAATWWCGQERARQYVLEHLEELFVKPAFRSRSRTVERGLELSEAEREALKRAIQFQPQLFVGQARLQFSDAPSWGKGGLKPRPVSLRVYLVASEGGYKVMPVV